MREFARKIRTIVATIWRNLLPDCALTITFAHRLVVYCAL
ncbi:hypothetical protein HMPREF3212_03496 [Citrobacter freundii]|nr:hypothetical protein HMPREF3212_03496 [Citrobacter freundii]